ncbi:MAG: thrombospondin type 3 repeat-containing protein [Akkermansiaceae bacterium]|nr:thrombospondin type 3 repeat-containing protein [Akkermansiaceae bacterium]
MSWFSKNYEKAALGGTVLVALGLVYLGWAKIGGVKDDFGTDLTGGGNNNTAVPGADRIPMARQSMKLDRTWTQAMDGDRPVDLFTGIALFIASSAPEKPLDLLKGDPLHPPIPNTWWLENRLDPGFADSPSRDPDADGFSNTEEFNAETDPNNPKSHPPLIAKLMFLKDESITWVIRPGYGSGGKFPFTYEDSKGRRNRITAANMIGDGELFFAEAPEANRFKLLGSEQRKELNKKINVEMDVTIVKIEDQRPNKKGDVYEFPAPLADDERKNAFVQYDRTAVFSLEALGLGGKEFKVEENTAFALPPDAAEKNYLLKSVTPETVTVEYADPAGNRATVTIGKGSFPNMNP